MSVNELKQLCYGSVENGGFYNVADNPNVYDSSILRCSGQEADSHHSNDDSYKESNLSNDNHNQK